MSRPRTYDDDRINTAVRIPRDLHEQLHTAAAERGVSANWLILRAIEDFIPRLIPVDELRLTRPREDPPT